MVDAVDIVVRIIRSNEYITIATVDAHGQPWNTPVYSAFDSRLNFYWASDYNSVHSTNIAGNPSVFPAPATEVWINGDGDKDGQYVDVRIEIPIEDLQRERSR